MKRSLFITRGYCYTLSSRYCRTDKAQAKNEDSSVMTHLIGLPFLPVSSDSSLEAKESAIYGLE